MIVCIFCENKGGWLNQLRIYPASDTALIVCDWCAKDMEIRATRIVLGEEQNNETNQAWLDCVGNYSDIAVIDYLYALNP